MGHGEASWGALTKTKQRELDEVLRLWRSAAEQGHADAQHNLGVAYDNGQSVKQDPAEAVRWFRKATEQGHAGGQCNLGFMYANGQGVKLEPKQLDLVKPSTEEETRISKCFIRFLFSFLCHNGSPPS